MIKDFHFNITDYDVKLDKLYEDAKKGSNVVSTNVQDVGNKVLAKPSGNVNSYGGTSSSDLEFVDFDNRVSGNKGNPSTITNSLNSNNNINSNNANVNGTTSSLNNNSNGNLTSSQGNTTLNNGITGTSTSKIDTSSNSSFTGASTTGINGSSQNGKDDNDFGFSGTNTSGVGNKTDSNVSNLNLNVDTDIDISTSIKNNLENASATVTSTSYLSNTTVPEEDLSDYIARLRKYGLTEEDINKIINGKASLEEIIAEIDSSIEDGRKGKMLEAAYLQACEIGFDSMDELDAAINKEKEKIAKYQEELKTVDNHEIEALMQIVIQVKQGNDLQSVLNNTIVAYKYTDSDGKTAYVYENPYDNGVAASEIDYEALTFEEMYPDSTDLKELEKVISTYGMWIESPEQVEFFNNLNSSYSNKQTSNTNTAKDINAKIAECESTIATYNGYKEFITGEVDYYLEYIHPYINSADFATNNSPSDKYAQTIDNILSKYQNVQTYDYNTNPPTEYINSKEDIVNVVGAMINGDVTLSGGYVVTPTALVAIESNELTLKHFEEWLPFITEEEKQIFNYIYNTQGIDATYDYIQGISSNLDQRWLADKTQSDQEFASEHPVLASVGSIVLTPIEGISAISYSINSYLRDIKISRTDVYSSGDVWRGTVANDIAQNYGEGWSFLYSTSMSIADSAALIAANLATGGIAAPALTAYIMGARVYVSTINDALDRGLSDGSAIALAFSSAVVESAMESYSLSHLLNLEKTFANSTLNITEYVGSQITDPKLAAIATKSAYIFGSAINQAIVEGEEEFSTEIFDYVLDELIAGDLSNHSLTIQRYLDLGYSEEEARNRANNELMNQATLAFLGGFLSGTLFGSLSAVQSTRVTSKRIANSIYEQFNNSGVKLSDTIASLEASNPSVATDLKTILDTLKSKYGTEELSLKVIRDYLDTGEVSILPTENNVQQLIQKYSIDEIRAYLNMPDTSYKEPQNSVATDLKTILDTLKSKYGTEELSLKVIRDYLDTGEVSILPTENNVQQLIQKYSIDEIRAYLNMPDTSYKEPQNSVATDLKTILDTLKSKYGTEELSLKVIRDYLDTGEVSILPTENNVQQLIQKYSIDEIRAYLNMPDTSYKEPQNSVATDLKTILDTLKSKYGTEELSLKVIRDYLDTGEVSILPTENNVQQLIQKYSIDEIRAYLNMPDTSYKEQTTTEDSLFVSELSSLYPRTTVTQEQLNKLYNDYKAGKVVINSVREILLKSYPSGDFVAQKGNMIAIYEHLRDWGFTEAQAEKLISDAWRGIINERGFDVYGINVNGIDININVQKDMDYTNQDMTLEKLQSELEKIPKYLLKPLKNVYVYDMVGPRELQNAIKYKLPNSFASASANNNRINFHPLGKPHDFSVIYHELAHVYDRSYGELWGAYGENVSSSEVWQEAEKADRAISNIFGVSNYANLTQSPVEDFAESVAFYYTNPEIMRQFPNRLNVLRKYLTLSENVDISQYGKPVTISGKISKDLAHNLKIVLENLREKYNNSETTVKKVLSKVFQTGDLSFIPRANGARNIMSFYNLSDIAQALGFNNINVGSAKVANEIKVKPVENQINDNRLVARSTNPSFNADINSAINTMITKYGKVADVNELIEQYLLTGNINLITRTNNARDLISKYSKNDIAQALGLTQYIKVEQQAKVKQPVNLERNLQVIIDTLHKAYGTPQVVADKINTYLDTGDLSLIPSTNNARELIQNISLNELRNKLKGTNLDTSQNIQKDMQTLVDTLSLKYNGEYSVSYILEQYLKTGKLNKITRTNNLRTLIQKYSINDLKEYFDIYDEDLYISFDTVKPYSEDKLKFKGISNIVNDFQSIIETLKTKLGSYQAAFNKFIDYLKNGDSAVIPLDNGARNTILKYSIEDLKNNFDILKNKVRTTMDDIKVRIDKIMNGVQPYFEYNRIPINFDIMFPSEFYKEPLRGHIVTEPKEEEILVDKDKLYDKQEEIYDTLEEIKDTPSPTQTVVTPEDNIQISDEDLLLLVKRTIRGDFGNGQERIDKLGRIYDLVQNQVNLNLDHGNTMWDNIQLYK